MNILNIDDLATPKRQLTIFGKTYETRDDSVQSFIDSIKLAEEMEKNKGKKSPVDQMEMLVKAVLHAVPGLPEVDVRRLNQAQMLTILAFARGEMDEKVESRTEESAPADNKSE